MDERTEENAMAGARMLGKVWAEVYRTLVGNGIAEPAAIALVAAYITARSMANTGKAPPSLPSAG